jgi:hypothetical protein
MVCVPFALCLAWAVRITVQRVATQRALGRIWPVILGIVAGTAYANPTELDWFRDRHTSRVAAGVRYCIAATPWDTRRDIYMTPSMYWRFRVLFPPTLRERLRVAVEATAPDWWRLTTTDIVERFRPLPAPGDAYLLATPEQLAGGAEVWDYFVPLPGAALDAWRRSAPLQVLNLGGRALIVPACATADNTRWRLMLLGGDALAVDPDGTRDHDPTAG